VLQLDNLDARTRQLMASEFERDVSSGTLYISGRLNTKGKLIYPDLLRTAIESKDADWLADSIRAGGLLNPTEQRKNGVVARVPVTAADTLAEGEFSRFYIRALCCRALEDGLPCLVACRCRAVENPRPESQAKVGSHVDPDALLADLRRNVGVETALGVPAGPNSGLAVRLP